MAKLSVSGLNVRLGNNDILRGVDAELADGEIIALLGRSGSGKSTLLRAIAGLETPSAGRITIGERPVFDSEAGINLPPEQRALGLVFQSYALWPHKTVRDNVGYGLKVRGRSAAEIDAVVNEALTGVGLGGLEGRYPGQLSGGQQQRVALARALAYRPPLILLDEPLSNLDAKLREEARLWIRELIKSAGLTAVFVTHDQSEAMAIADRVMLLDGGVVVQHGTPQALYRNPENLFAADFMGINNSFPTTVIAIDNAYAQIAINGQTFWGANCSGLQPGDAATAVIRLEQTALVDEPATDAVAARRVVSTYLGDRWEHSFDAHGIRLRATSPDDLAGDSASLRLPRDALWLF